MPTSKKFAASKEPNKQPGQCEVSWEVLHPVIAVVDVEDPSMKRRRGHLTRKGYIIRVDIPAGVVPASFVPEISADGRTAVFSCHMEQSRYISEYTLGKELHEYGTGVALGMQTATQELWSWIKDKHTRSSVGGDTKDYKRYSVNLPEECERELRDPCREWEINDIGQKGSSVNIDVIRSTFYYFGIFTMASKDVTPAIASMNTLLRMEDVRTDNPMNSTNLARRNYYNQQRINDGVASPVKTRSNSRTPRKSHKKSHRRSTSKSHRRSRSKRRSKSRSRRHQYESESESESNSSEEDINNSFDRMSICSSTKRRESRGSTRQRQSKDHHSSGHYSETTSQCRHRLKGKQRKLIDILEKEENQRLARMRRAELEELDRNLDRNLNENARNNTYDLRSEASIPVVVTTNDDGTRLNPDVSQSNSEALFSTPSSRLSESYQFSFTDSKINKPRASVSQSASDSL